MPSVTDVFADDQVFPRAGGLESPNIFTTSCSFAASNTCRFIALTKRRCRTAVAIVVAVLMVVVIYMGWLTQKRDRLTAALVNYNRGRRPDDASKKLPPVKPIQVVLDVKLTRDGPRDIAVLEKRIGPLAPGEVFIPVPHLLLGGDGNLATYEKGDFEVYLDLVAQTHGL